MLFAEYLRFYARFFVLFVVPPVVPSLSLREDCSASHAGHIWRDTGKGHLYSSCLVKLRLVSARAAQVSQRLHCLGMAPQRGPEVQASRSRPSCP